MNRKLIVRLKGGLGNQLFCYAAARRLAWANDAELVLDAVTGFKYDHMYQRSYALSAFPCIDARWASSTEQMEPFGRLRRLIARKFSEQHPLDKRRYVQQVGVHFDPDILTWRLQPGTTYFDAFGQSEKYFSDISELLMKDLAMSEPRDANVQSMTQQIQRSQSVALHVRWFDSGDTSHTSNMSTSYYKQAIATLLKKIGPAHYFIFSDRPQHAQELIEPHLQGQTFSLVQHKGTSQNDAEFDFWLMRQCKHYVIGNSTFAWWAAWLGEHDHPGAQVIAPSRNVDPNVSVTAWGFPGLLPERWSVI
jgi:hypothetical protein